MPKKEISLQYFLALKAIAYNVETLCLLYYKNEIDGDMKHLLNQIDKIVKCSFEVSLSNIQLEKN